MNRMELIGRLTRDVELNSTNSGIFVAKLSVAVNRKFQNASGEKETDFFNVVAWRGLAENISKYCHKGSKVFISGELQTRSYEAQDGTTKYITEIIANECEFLDSKNSSQTEQSDQNQPEEIKDENLPF